MGDAKVGGRRRAVGIRDRVMSYLVTVGEISDASGMASIALAEAVAYPGSSIAFAQLLSGMDRSGLIEREIRGKRTYRIAPTPAAAAEVAAAQAAARTELTSPVKSRRSAAPSVVSARRGARGAAGAGTADSRGLVVAAKGAEDFDYDELARRLLVQVVQRLAASPEQGTAPEAADVAERAGTRPEDAELAKTVASLEHKLASVRSRQRKLTEENARLREQLRAAQESLAHAEEQAEVGRGTRQLDSAEVSLLERLLSPLRDKGDRRGETGTG